MNSFSSVRLQQVTSDDRRQVQSSGLELIFLEGLCLRVEVFGTKVEYYELKETPGLHVLTIL